MIKHTIITSVLVASLLLTGVGYTNAQTTETTSTGSLIETLLKRIAELQAQLKSLQGEVDGLIKAGLTEGMTDSEIKEIQELLATDPTIYPSGLTTGYFGPMTREAIKRFQEKFGLEVTGTLNEETRQALTEVRKERREKGMQTGLLRSEEVRERIKMRLKDKWENCDYVRPGKEAFCKDKKDKSDSDDDDDMKDEDEDDDSDDQEVSRDAARRAVADAQNELNHFRADLEDLDGDERDEAKDIMRDAQEEMSKARRALARQEFGDAFESAEEVIEILEGEDSEDDDDDMDEDEDDDDDKDDDDSDDDEEDDD